MNGWARSSLAWAALAVAVSVLVLGRVEPPSGVPPARTPPAPEVPVAAVPEAFEPWPPLVVSWEVVGWPQWTRRNEASPPPRTDGPCEVVGSGACHVRLAWATGGRWTLTLSADPRFEAEDTFVVGDPDAPSPPPSPARVCQGLLSPSDGGVRAEWRTERGPPQPGLLTVAFVGRQGELARCLTPWGVPLSFTREGFAWQWSSLSFRHPSRAELGEEGVPAALP